MAGNEPTGLTTIKTTYTLDEASEYMKMKDKQPTNTGTLPIRWINVKTGKEVIIGYTS